MKIILIIIIILVILVIYFFISRSSENKEVIENNNQKQSMKTETLKEGTGAVAENSDKVTVHYVGILENGTKFDSSVDRGTPFTFTLGIGQVIKGWDQGVLGMKVGEKRRLTIPSDLAYGDSGVGSIPPKSTLIFEVELLRVDK